MSKSKFLFVVGPTGTGKTSFAIELSQKTGWPIINCDSLQVYKFLDVGTAKPTQSQREEVPHHLFDYISPPQRLSASDYVNDVTDLLSRKGIEAAIFVGGSGFYIQALEKGLFQEAHVPEDIQTHVGELLKNRGGDFLYEEITKRDPQHAKKIHPNDHYRLQRALGLLLSQTKTITELQSDLDGQQRSPLGDHQSLHLAFQFEKTEMAQRVRVRTKQMLKEGLLEETRKLIQGGFGEWPPLASVGYKECVMCLRGELSEVGLEERINISTMQLIKKQKTWFQRDPKLQWIPGTQPLKAFEFIDSFV